MAVLDLHSAIIFLFFALLTLFTPTFFRRAIRGTSGWRQQSYSALAAEFVDAVQGLATLKVFGQSEQRGRELGRKAYDLYQATMAVLALNIGASGIANACLHGLGRRDGALVGRHPRQQRYLGLDTVDGRTLPRRGGLPSAARAEPTLPSRTRRDGVGYWHVRTPRRAARRR